MADLIANLQAAAGAAGGGGWDISTAVYDSGSDFSVATQDSLPEDIVFKTDGTKMYIVGSGNDKVYEYDLSTSWDVSTASYVQDFSVSAQETLPRGVVFKPDGTKMYVIGATGDDVNEYDLSTAWNISTASYVQSFLISAQDSNPFGLFFKDDGIKMYVLGGGNDRVNEYSLSTAWNISTASFVRNFSVNSQDTNPNGLFFKPDGLKMYVVGDTNNKVYEYDLSTAWNISTASYVQDFGVGSQASFPTGLFFKPDGLKLYITDATTDKVFSYTLS